MENVHVVIVYDSLDVLHAAVTNFNFISVEYLIKDVDVWEMGIYYGSFKPYQKPDGIIQYINKESNHPPSITEHLPASIEKRLSNNSSD